MARTRARAHTHTHTHTHVHAQATHTTRRHAPAAAPQGPAFVLVDVVRTLKDININVVSAEINTIGPTARDELFITYAGAPLSGPMTQLTVNALQASDAVWGLLHGVDGTGRLRAGLRAGAVIVGGLGCQGRQR